MLNGGSSRKDMNGAFKFMHNVVQWMSERHSSRGKVLLYGDRNKYTSSYNVKVSSGSGFRKSIPSVISIAGYDPVVKDYDDYNGVYPSKKASISLNEMNKYASIIVMSSGGWSSLDNETANNFCNICK